MLGGGDERESKMPGTDHAANCHGEESPMGQSDGGFPLENGK